MDKLFFTGVPGSRWSGIAQTLESMPGFNISDRTPERTYTHHQYSGHVGAYFGKGMEFEADPARVDQAYSDPGGIKVIKSHEWIDHVNQIKALYPHTAQIMLVYRPDQTSFAWWHEAGGFQIKYPNYDYYENSAGMLAEITRCNQKILQTAYQHNATWSYFTSQWVIEHFAHDVNIKQTFSDILVTII